MRSKTIIHFTEEELQNIISDPNSQVLLKENVDYQAALTPVCLQDPEAAIYAMLDRNLMAYIPKYKGILLSYKNVRTRKSTGHIDGDNYHIFIDLIVDLYMFVPTVGCILKGIVSKKSQDGVGCLVHKGFNVAIPRPWDGSNNEWPGHAVNIGEEVSLQVEVLNFSGRLPYIRGNLLSNITTVKKRKKHKKNKVQSEVISDTEQDDTIQHEKETSDAFSDSCEVKNKSRKKKRLKHKSESEHLYSQETEYPSEREELQFVPSSDISTHSIEERKRHKKKSKHKLRESNETVSVDPAQPNSNSSSGFLMSLNGSLSDLEHSFKKHKKSSRHSTGSKKQLEESDTQYSSNQLSSLQHDGSGQIARKHSRTPEASSNHVLNNLSEVQTESILDEFKLDFNHQHSKKKKKRKSTPQKQEFQDFIDSTSPIRTELHKEDETSEFITISHKHKRKRKHVEQACSDNEIPEVKIKKTKRSSKDEHEIRNSTSKHLVKGNAVNMCDEKKKSRTSSVSSLSEEF